MNIYAECVFLLHFINLLFGSFSKMLSIFSSWHSQGHTFRRFSDKSLFTAECQ